MALPFIKKASSLVVAQVLFCSVQAQTTTGSTASSSADSSTRLPSLVRAKEAVPAIIQPLHGGAGSLTQAGRELLQPLHQKVALLKNIKKFQVHQMQAGASYQYLRDTSGAASGLLGYNRGSGGVLFQAEVSVAALPFNFSLSRSDGFYAVEHTPFSQFYQAHFDPRKYRELLQSEVLKKIKPEQVTASIQKRILAIRQQYEQALLVELNSVQDELMQEVKGGLPLPTHITDLSFSDRMGLRNELFRDLSLEKYQQEVRRLAEIRAQGLPIADSSLLQQEVMGTIKRYEAMEKIYARILRAKEQYERNKVVQELKKHLPFTPASFKEYLAKPENLESVIREHGDLKSLQRIFLNLTRLDLGKAPLQQGQLTLQDLINTGINARFQSKKATLGFVQGVNNNANQWMQAGLKSFTTNEYSSLSGLTIGNGSGRGVDQNLSLLLFNFQNNPEQYNEAAFLQEAYLPMAGHRDAVITWQSEFSVDEQNEIKLDVSKSFGSFRNFLSSDSIAYESKAFPSVFSDEGIDNFAFSLDYSGVLWQTPVKLYLKRVGLGYSNPGNVFLRRGSREGGLDLSRRFLKQKLQVQYRTSYRQQSLDVDKQYKYLTYTNRLKASYRIKRNHKMGLSYEQSDYRSDMPLQPSGEGKSYRMQVEGSYDFYLWGKKVMNNANISGQRMQLPMVSAGAYQSRSWLMMHTSSALIHRNLLSFTLMRNQSDQQDYYFNTSFASAELNYSYSPVEGVQWTSGGGYYSNSGWNKQLGMRQQLSALVWKKCSIDLEVNYKKAVQVQRPELANQLFVSSAVRYHFQ